MFIFVQNCKMWQKQLIGTLHIRLNQFTSLTSKTFYNNWTLPSNSNSLTNKNFQSGLKNWTILRYFHYPYNLTSITKKTPTIWTCMISVVVRTLYCYPQINAPTIIKEQLVRWDNIANIFWILWRKRLKEASSLRKTIFADTLSK